MDKIEGVSGWAEPKFAIHEPERDIVWFSQENRRLQAALDLQSSINSELRDRIERWEWRFDLLLKSTEK